MHIKLWQRYTNFGKFWQNNEKSYQQLPVITLRWTVISALTFRYKKPLETPINKGKAPQNLKGFFVGRDTRIRTWDPLLPKSGFCTHTKLKANQLKVELFLCY